MSAGKNRLKGHIIAAREWLGRAEKSIEQDNAIKSDLNLMLAQAELQRAKETRPAHGPLAKAAWRLLPVAAAAVVVWAGFCLVTPSLQETPVPLMKTAEEKVPAAKPLPAGSPETLRPQPVQRIEEKTAVPESHTAVPPVPVEIADKKAAVATPVETLKPAVPTEEMQKLMRSAGRTLRAQ